MREKLAVKKYFLIFLEKIIQTIFKYNLLAGLYFFSTLMVE